MTDRLLTEAERRRFAEWLRQDAMSNDLLAKQLDSMYPPLARNKRILAAAQLLVAKEMEGWESQSVGGEPSCEPDTQ